MFCFTIFTNNIINHDANMYGLFLLASIWNTGNHIMSFTHLEYFFSNRAVVSSRYNAIFVSKVCSISELKYAKWYQLFSQELLNILGGITIFLLLFFLLILIMIFFYKGLLQKYGLLLVSLYKIWLTMKV